jgi:Raf kinase inhibitor-like YbhB/YbcL family protein
MTTMTGLRHVAIAVLALTSFGIGTGHAAEKDASFTVSSPAVKDDGVLPTKYAGAAECGGKNVSLPLAWKNPPPSTKSFVVMMTDPDGRRGLGSVHWIAYNIPYIRSGIKEGDGAGKAKDITGGKNSRGTDVYTGPCAPAADALHHYVIQVVATDLNPGFLQPGLDHAELLNMINGHSLAPASMVVRYHRKS